MLNLIVLVITVVAAGVASFISVRENRKKIDKLAQQHLDDDLQKLQDYHNFQHNARESIKKLYDEQKRLDTILAALSTRTTKLEGDLASKQEVLDDDESFLEKAKLTNQVNVIAKHTSKKTVEDALNKQLPELVAKEARTLKTLLIAVLESEFILKRRAKPKKVTIPGEKLDMAGLDAQVRAATEPKLTNLEQRLKEVNDDLITSNLNELYRGSYDVVPKENKKTPKLSRRRK